MFASRVSRTGLLITVLGLVVLYASYYVWRKSHPLHALYETQDDYRWVRADSSSDPAIESGEVWQASATCQLPYFIGATLRAKAELKAFYDAAPEEISEWRDRPARPRIPRAPSSEVDFQNLLKREQAELDRSIAEAEYDSQLHAKYMEWYAIVSKLEDQAKQWQQRLIKVADQRLTLGEADNQNFIMLSANGIKQVGASENLEQHMLSLLGLGGFSKDELQALKTRCVEVIPVKRILTQAKLWHWPISYPASFWLGLELVLIGLFFRPISRWISAGDPRAAWRHVRHTAQRLIATTRMVLKDKFASGDLALTLTHFHPEHGWPPMSAFTAGIRRLADFPRLLPNRRQ
ncbi:MAG TPA: hypothetical protein VK430_02710 [Xanthobacteraceae bacterium]|nr:hypothetical protein [Xanthobacteraceae bacterium]